MTGVQTCALPISAIGGLAFDELSGLLFVAERSVGPFGKGIIHVYRLEETGSLFQDGFESGDASGWSDVVGESMDLMR